MSQNDVKNYSVCFCNSISFCHKPGGLRGQNVAKLTDPRLCKRLTMSKSAKTTPGDGEGPEASDEAGRLLNFYRVLGRLKTTKRTGWLRSGVHLPESISDHMYRMSMMALTWPAQPGLDTTHALQLALVHDVAEALVGDITPQDNVSKEEKFELERDAMRKICNGILDGGETAKRLFELWLEYEQGETEEAQFVKQLDKFEMVVQADEYERDQERLDLSDFFSSTRDVLSSGPLRAVDRRLRDERAARRKAESYSAAARVTANGGEGRHAASADASTGTDTAVASSFPLSSSSPSQPPSLSPPPPSSSSSSTPPPPAASAAPPARRA